MGVPRHRGTRPTIGSELRCRHVSEPLSLERRGKPRRTIPIPSDRGDGFRGHGFPSNQVQAASFADRSFRGRPGCPAPPPSSRASRASQQTAPRPFGETAGYRVFLVPDNRSRTRPLRIRPVETGFERPSRGESRASGQVRCSLLRCYRNPETRIGLPGQPSRHRPASLIRRPILETITSRKTEGCSAVQRAG